MKNQIKEEFVIILVCFTFLLRPSASQSQCSPSFTLPNILKDIVFLEYAGGIEQSYQYMFFSGMFSGPPLIAYTLSSLSIEQTSAMVNYYLNVETQDMYIFFNYNSPSFQWNLVSVSFWITSRSDIVVIRNVIDSPVSAQNTTLNFQINNTLAAIDSQSTHALFIVGLFSTFTQNLSIGVIPGTLSSTTASLVLDVGSAVTVTNISVLSVIYNSNTGQFLSSSGTLNYKSFTSQSFNLLSNFMPIYYVLTGISSFSLTTPNLAIFTYSLDVNNTILSASSNTAFDAIGISYTTIGALTLSVCSPCNNLFFNDNCVDSCPSLTYPYTFFTGGKACLSCNSKAGQMLNSLSTGCSCLPGYQLISISQCVSSSQAVSICSGANVIQNGSACICSPGTFNISGNCSTCQSWQIYQSGACINTSTSSNIPTLSCPPGQTYDQITKTCKCGSSSIKVGSICVSCSAGTFADLQSNLCTPCIANCLVCLNRATCWQCTGGFEFDFSALACVNPNAPIIQRLISIRPGFPVYTLEGLVTDFVINSNLVSIKSMSDLMQMVSMQFADKNTLPLRTYIAQNASQLNQIRISFYYQGLIPLNAFKVLFIFNDSAIKLQENTTLTYQYSIKNLQYRLI